MSRAACSSTARSSESDVSATGRHGEMRARQSGTIVNIVSDAAIQASPKAGPAYVMSKFGLAGLTQSINAEESPCGAGRLACRSTLYICRLERQPKWGRPPGLRGASAPPPGRPAENRR